MASKKTNSPKEDPEITQGNKSDQNPGPSEASIIKSDITDEMQRAYLDYAMSVIVSRALPDVRDGLKPVHRRIVYAMYDQKITYSGKLHKSAAVGGGERKK